MAWHLDWESVQFMSPAAFVWNLPFAISGKRSVISIPRSKFVLCGPRSLVSWAKATMIISDESRDSATPESSQRRLGISKAGCVV